MSTYRLKVYGKVVRFAAKSMTQALFARDAHVASLRDKAKERAKAKRIAENAIASVCALAIANHKRAA